MTPANIAGMAALKGLDVIALTDHNTCRNCPAILEAADAYGVLAIPGMEITTSEEVHVLCLFENLLDALSFDNYVYQRLLPIPNKPEIFGQQQIYDSNDQILGEEPLLLINSTSISFDNLWRIVHDFHGVMVPAHIDKSTTSLISNLGFVPPDSLFKTAELKNLSHLHALQKTNPYLKDCHIISNSDAHYLQDINEPLLTIPVKNKTCRDILNYLDHI